MINTELIVTLGGLFVGYVLLEYLFGVKQYPGEPKYVAPLIPVPYLGHLLGLIRDKMSYYDNLSKRSSLSIFTVPAMGGGRVYVIKSSELVLAVFRNVQSFSFAALAIGVVSRISLLSEQGAAIVSEAGASNASANGKSSSSSSLSFAGPAKPGYTSEIFKVIHSSLAPGEGLDAMIEQANKNILESMETLVPANDGKGGATRIKMYKWMKHEIAMATTTAVYGPLNPFRSPEVETAFWDFEREFTSLLVGFLPSVISSKGHHGRARVHEAFAEYFRKNGHGSASKLIQVRHATAIKHGLSDLDTAKLEASMSIGILGTTSPASFWMLYYVFSDPPTLARLREEIDAVITVTRGADGNVVHRVLSGAGLQKSCPLLKSTWHEMLRLSTCSTSARKVQADTRLPDGSLLKEGSVIQMPSRSSHVDTATWGSSAMEFEADRFIKGSGPSSSQPNKVPAGAFRPFSGGNTLCPGRHLAVAEILAIVAMIVARFDMTPVADASSDDDGHDSEKRNSSGWVRPQPYASSVAAAIYSPTVDPEVDVTLRKGFEQGTWAFADIKSE